MRRIAGSANLSVTVRHGAIINACRTADFRQLTQLPLLRPVAEPLLPMSIRGAQDTFKPRGARSV